jgi:hypothetical protein
LCDLLLGDYLIIGRNGMNNISIKNQFYKGQKKNGKMFIFKILFGKMIFFILFFFFENQLMIHDFLTSAEALLSKKGSIFITLRNTEFYSSWDIPAIVTLVIINPRNKLGGMTDPL